MSFKPKRTSSVAVRVCTSWFMCVFFAVVAVAGDSLNAEHRGHNAIERCPRDTKSTILGCQDDDVNDLAFFTPRTNEGSVVVPTVNVSACGMKITKYQIVLLGSCSLNLTPQVYIWNLLNRQWVKVDSASTSTPVHLKVDVNSPKVHDIQTSMTLQKNFTVAFGFTWHSSFHNDDEKCGFALTLRKHCAQEHGFLVQKADGEEWTEESKERGHLVFNVVAQDLDECEGDQWNKACQSEGQICRNEPGSFHCECKGGYSQNSSDNTCQDVNECSHSSVCSNSSSREEILGTTPARYPSLSSSPVPSLPAQSCYGCENMLGSYKCVMKACPKSSSESVVSTTVSNRTPSQSSSSAATFPRSSPEPHTLAPSPPTPTTYKTLLPTASSNKTAAQVQDADQDGSSSLWSPSLWVPALVCLVITVFLAVFALLHRQFRAIGQLKNAVDSRRRPTPPHNAAQSTPRTTVTSDVEASAPGPCSSPQQLPASPYTEQPIPLPRMMRRKSSLGRYTYTPMYSLVGQLSGSAMLYEEPPQSIVELCSHLASKEKFTIRQSDLKLKNVLGSGEFGIVYKGYLDAEKRFPVAVKVLRQSEENQSEGRCNLLQEAAILQQFSHQNVLHLIGVVQEPVMLVLELLEKGDLRTFLVSQRSDRHRLADEKLPETLLRMCQEIAEGLLYLSSRGFVHRDIAARNILLNEELTCKIADFGMSRQLVAANYYKSRGGKIPVKWTAPEALLYNNFSSSSDVWSFGVVLFEVWALGRVPFLGKMHNQVILFLCGMYHRLPPPAGCSRPLYEVMIDCWHPEANSRPTFGELAERLSDNDHMLSTTEGDGQIGGCLEAVEDRYDDLRLKYAHLQNTDTVESLPKDESVLQGSDSGDEEGNKHAGEEAVAPTEIDHDNGCCVDARDKIEDDRKDEAAEMTN